MPKSRNYSKKSRTTKRVKQRQTVVVVLLMFAAFAAVVYSLGAGERMNIFEAVSDSWEGDISIGGFVENGNLYATQDDLPTEATVDYWNDLKIRTNMDGDIRLRGYAGIGSTEINTDLPYPEEYNQLEGYPTAKPEFEWEIVDNIQHVDVNGDYLQSGVPSVVSQENGLLVEAYYYTFSVQLTLYPQRAVTHDFYFMNFNEFGFGCRYFFEAAPLRGLYLLPEISLTSNNESITDLGSDLATYGPTQWRFYNEEGQLVQSSVVENEFAEHTYGFNRDFFMAGGDSSAGLNLYKQVDENTNQFSVGFVKAGIPGYMTGTVGDAEILHTVQTTVYKVELAIPLRMSVIAVYDISYDIPTDDFYYGDVGSGDEQNDEDYWFTPLEDTIQDYNMKAGGDDGPLLSEDILYPAVIVGCVVLALVIRRF